MAKWEGFYSAHQISRLAGIPLQTLYLWKKRGIFRPSIRIVNADGSTEEGYSYGDLAVLKLLRALRLKQLNLKSAAITCRHLYERFGSPRDKRWANAHVYIVGKDVFAHKPDNWETTLATKYGQKVDAYMLAVDKLFEEDAALIVPSAFSDYVEVDPNVMQGQPVIRDTRVPTSLLIALRSEGWEYGDIAQWYAPIPINTIKKAVEFEKHLDEGIRPKATAKARASTN